MECFKAFKRANDGSLVTVYGGITMWPGVVYHLPDAQDGKELAPARHGFHGCTDPGWCFYQSPYVVGDAVCRVVLGDPVQDGFRICGRTCEVVQVFSPEEARALVQGDRTLSVPGGGALTEECTFRDGWLHGPEAVKSRSFVWSFHMGTLVGFRARG
jgi:hypothetical protein